LLVATPGPVLDRQLEEFYREDYERIVGSLARKYGDADLAREAVDEALTRAWTRLQEGQSIASLPAWVRTVATNVARDRLRRRATEARVLASVVTLDDTDPTPVDLVNIDLERTLAILPPRQREITTLRYVHDLSCDQIARELGITPGYVRQSLHRARRVLTVALAVTALIVATVLMSTERDDPVQVDITPVTQPTTPTTNVSSEPGADAGAGAEIQAGDPATDAGAGTDVARDESPNGSTRAAGTVPVPTSAATRDETDPSRSPTVVGSPADTPASAAASPTTPTNPTTSTTVTTQAAPVPDGEPTAETVTVTCCDWGLDAPYREVFHGGRASQWTIAPSGDITLRLYAPPNTSQAYSLHIAADVVTPEPPRNIIGGWTVGIAPGEAVILQVRNLRSLQMKDCWVEGCRLEFFAE
jgi:RNA polymerase sigma-70 factor (ECF subfamily)